MEGGEALHHLAAVGEDGFELGAVWLMLLRLGARFRHFGADLASLLAVVGLDLLQRIGESRGEALHFLGHGTSAPRRWSWSASRRYHEHRCGAAASSNRARCRPAPRPTGSRDLPAGACTPRS